MFRSVEIVKDLGLELGPKSMIMDFGCGSGNSVHQLRELGYQTFGCDLQFKDPNANTEAMKQKGIIRLIDLQNYALPFETGSFDAVFSDQVFEHVQDYSQALSEIARVLKPDGLCLHIFPSRYTPIEPHVSVPFASVIKSYWWLYLWAAMGIRSETQRGKSAKETAVENYDYLKHRTNYLPKQRIVKEFRAHFVDVLFAEDIFLLHSKKGKYIHRLSKFLPFLPRIYSALRVRVVLARHPSNAQALARAKPRF
jgi:ubiquinone/menaquinone biosynthesis C-methylase UbiE